VVAGFVRHVSGHVCFDGELADEIPAERREVGFVFQSYALFPHMSAGDNIAFPLRARGVPREERRQRVNEALELVRLGGFAARPVTSLSGGQQQRVALARALVFRPRVLLLDEPLAALDQGLRQAMQHELKRIQTEVGVTTIAVTHDQTEALTMSDRVAVLREGRIEQVGTPEELYRRPRTRFVSTFLGESNLLPVSEGELGCFGVRVDGRRSGLALLRPEDLSLSSNGDGGATCAAVVEAIDFQGWRYRLAARSRRSGERLLVSLPPDSSYIEGLHGGADVTIACRHPERMHILESEPASSGPEAAEPVSGAV
jgi:putative spermidine/putrescine transport system ATP-binding protein